MFGKTKSDDTEFGIDPAALENEILGDEMAAERAATMDDAVQRLGAIERQLHSQFTSMAAYAQIAQEQVELARSEARAENEQLERRLLSLVERERADRLAEEQTRRGQPSVTERLDAVERLVVEVRAGLTACLEQQKLLAEAITRHLAPRAPQPLPAPSPGARPATVRRAHTSSTNGPGVAADAGRVDDCAPIAALRLD